MPSDYVLCSFLPNAPSGLNLIHKRKISTVSRSAAAVGVEADWDLRRHGIRSRSSTEVNEEAALGVEPTIYVFIA